METLSNSFEFFFRSGTVNLEMINEISTYTPPLSLLYITSLKSKDKNVCRPNIKDT